jgi:glucose dehydrogenase
MSYTLTADVAIIGSGVAGALIAAHLAERGFKVTILEAGEEVDRSAAVDRYWAAAIKVPECPYPPVPQAMHPVSDNLSFWYQQSGTDKFASTYIKTVGGTTWHWLGTALRMVPADFELRKRFGRGEDWPISYATLSAYYDRAERELGVSGDGTADLGSPRSTDYPMPAIPQTYLDKAFASALQGSVYDVRSTPQARNSKDQSDRPACCGNASCIPVCPVQAKYDATVHVARATKAGALLLSKTNVVALETGDDSRITAAKFIRWDGSTGSLKARHFVLAGHAIESPRLLLNSASERLPKGVANSSDQVGRNLMDHPTQLSWALATMPVYPYRGPLSTSGIENLRDGDFRRTRGAFRIEIGNDGWSWPTGAPISTAAEFANKGLRGKELGQALRQQTSRHVRLASLVEQLPDAANRVTLDSDKRDIYGVPLPRLYYQIDSYVHAGLAAARTAHQEIFDRLGVSEMHHSPQVQGAGHIIGTLRMGSDASNSVVDADLRSHDHPNLFISGSSVFPTSATANPTLTIAALALRIVDKMIATAQQ